MNKDQRVFVATSYDVIEGLFVSETNNWIYVLNGELGTVAGHNKSLVFATKEEAQAYLIKTLKDRISNFTTLDNRLTASKELLDKLEKISEEFDLKKKSAK